MTDTDRISQMAREAELIEPRDEWDALPKSYTDAITKLISLVAEDCAKLAELADTGELSKGDIEFNNQRGHDAAQAIRARYSTSLATPPGDA